MLTQPESPIRWLHISDFHLKSTAPYDQDHVLSALIGSLPALVARYGKPDFVIASGDIAFSGRADEYTKATELFDRVLVILGLPKDKLFIVPGNHDVDRRRGIGLARTLDSTSQADQYFSPDGCLIHTEQRLKYYADWYDSYFNGIRAFSRERTFNIEGVNISGYQLKIVLFNSSSFCLDENDSGKLLIGRRSARDAAKGIEDFDGLKIAVIHHPFSWLNPVELTEVKSIIHDAFDCVLSGHLHENEVEDVAGTSGTCLHLAAGASYQTERWPNTALLCRYDHPSIKVVPIHYTKSPRPNWTLDTSLFPQSDDYSGTFSVKRFDEEIVAVHDVINPENTDLAVQADESGEIGALREQIDDRLFTTPSGTTVYAEPRLMPRSQVAALDKTDEKALTILEIAKSEDSFLIEARPEYGGSLLCRLIQIEITKLGQPVILRNARDMPNYQKKLAQDFVSDLSTFSTKPVIVIDDIDLERDERLISELEAGGWFQRVILVSVNRRLTELVTADVDTMPFKPKILFLWAMGREGIREFASTILDPNDAISESRAVDKVYSDLLGLKIPLTPSNVIMYLRVLQREGDFEPLSRVDILSRYLAESLRKPSDVASDSFNFKNKMDVLSSFAYSLHDNKSSEFDERQWMNFCQKYQDKTLSEFDSRSFLNELIESRILSSYSGGIYFKYSFYYTFFVGRYLWPRPQEIEKFFGSDDYLVHGNVIDVITGLSSENSALVTLLLDKLDNHLNEFASKYVKPSFDPLALAEWPSNENEEEDLWEPVQKAISQGPADGKAIDDLKTSMLAEARTSNQQVTFEKFTQLENALFAESHMLADALKNADDIDGPLKVRAWKAILQSVLVVLQVGTMFAPALAKGKLFNWGGVTFLNFDKAAEGIEDKPVEIILSVITSLADVIASKVSQDYASVKLAPVFRNIVNSGSSMGFIELVNFACIATSRGKDWADTLSKIIQNTDKNAYYLGAMLDQLMLILGYEIMTGRDRESIKRLVALIQAKRALNKQLPPAKAVSRMVDALEKDDFFPEEVRDSSSK